MLAMFFILTVSNFLTASYSYAKSSCGKIKKFSVSCDADDIGAEVWINGELSGKCPVADIVVCTKNNIHLKVVKKVDADHVRMFVGMIPLFGGPDNVNVKLTLQPADERIQLDRKAAVDVIVKAIEANMVAIPGKKYAIGKYEVTVAEHKAVMALDPDTAHREQEKAYYVAWYAQRQSRNEKAPILLERLSDLTDFIKFLNLATGKNYRLPTDDEWEYACLGGSKTDYCGGNDLGAVAWYSGNSKGGLQSVGQKQANGYGLFDMSGNAWEAISYDNRIDNWNARGGDRNTEPKDLRFDHKIRAANTGLRLALTLPSITPAKPTSSASTIPESTKQEEAEFNVPIPIMVAIPGRNYEIGKYEVTQREWSAVMGSNPSKFRDNCDNCPVDTVSWDNVQEYIKKLNQKTGKRYRLPKEAEWEYACYGGSQTEYCGSNDINAVAWYEKNAITFSNEGRGGSKETQPVGQKQANGYGLFDMSGNVWEWMDNCWDDKCDKHVARGGSWKNDPQSVRAAYRVGFSSRTVANGFRLARTLP